MKMHQVLKVPVQAHFSTLAESNIIITSLMIRRIVGKLVTPLPKILNLGGNSHTRVEDAVTGVEVETRLISLRHPTPNSVNDNYWEIDPPVTNLLEGQKTSQIDCKLRYCFSYTLCNRAVAKERHKPQSGSKRNQVCQRCLLCKSLSLCPKCPSCCQDPPVGGRLQTFWEVWLSLGSNPRVVSILKEGYSLPFKVRPPLTRPPLIVSGYANPVKNKHLKESLQALIQKQVVEKVIVPSSLAFYNRLLLVPKPNNKWRPILDLSQLNLYLVPSYFNMETPETIRLSLQQGEWITLLDFSDAYFHIPISQRSQKYLRFHLNSQTFQFTALPFGLSTAPLEFTKVVKEVKLMAQAQGIQIHQYLDDWLLRAPCQEMCQQHTQTLLDLCRDLGWVVNLSKSELAPQQVFNFVGYHYDLSQPGEVDSSVTENQPSVGARDLLSQAVDVPNRASDSHRKTGGDFI